MSNPPDLSPTPIEPWEVLDLLTSLVQKSLVVYEEDEQGQGRYRLLETVRQYARDRLVAAGEGETFRDRHRAFFLAMAEAIEPKLGSADQAEWLDRLEHERENIRAALEWSVGAPGGADSILRLVSATGAFWHWRFYRREGADWLLRALQEASGEPTPLRGKALFWAHVLGGGAAADPLALLRESVATYRQLGDQRGLIVPLAELARVTRSDAASAMALHEESVKLAREVADQHRLGYALWAMSFTLIDQEDWGQAETVLQEHRRLQQESGSPMGAAISSRQLGRVAMRQGEYARAKSFFMESLAASRLVGDVDGVLIALFHLAEIALREGDYPQARARGEEGLALARTTGHPVLMVHTLGRLGHLARDLGDYEGAAAYYRESLALRRELKDRFAMTQSLEDFAVLAARQGQAERAARLLGAAEAQCEAIGLPPPATPRTVYEPALTEARSALGETAFAAAWAEGRAMPLERAVEYALQAGDIDA